jgi:hypothetical protein
MMGDDMEAPDQATVTGSVPEENAGVPAKADGASPAKN